MHWWGAAWLSAGETVTYLHTFTVFFIWQPCSYSLHTWIWAISRTVLARHGLCMALGSETTPRAAQYGPRKPKGGSKMLRSMYERLNYRTEARDGIVGSLDDFLMDDRTWAIRYAVIDTGKWLPGRKIIMAHSGMGEPDWPSRTIPLNVTKAEIEAAPTLAQARPVSRQYEEYLFQHYNWAPYWGPGAAGGMGFPVTSNETAATSPRSDEFKKGDPHLRSFNELRGYKLVAHGEKAGRIDNFMCYDETWEIPFLVASVGGWFHQKSLMVPTSHISNISFPDREMDIRLDREALAHLPMYDPLKAEAGRLEVCVYDYRGRLLKHEPIEEHIEQN